jgi:hypothetical protein
VKKTTVMDREPKGMCRSCSSTRGGFTESYGAGIQLQWKLSSHSNEHADLWYRGADQHGDGQQRPICSGSWPGYHDYCLRCVVGASKPTPLQDLKYRRRQFDDDLENM